MLLVYLGACGGCRWVSERAGHVKGALEGSVRVAFWSRAKIPAHPRAGMHRPAEGGLPRCSAQEHDFRSVAACGLTYRMETGDSQGARVTPQILTAYVESVAFAICKIGVAGGMGIGG